MSNVNQNLLNQALDPEIIIEIMENLETVEHNLPDATLNEEQRLTYNAISVDNKVFAEHVLDQMTTNTTVDIPSFYNKDFLANDLALNSQAHSIRSRMMNIVQRLDDIIRLTGHEAYGMSTSVYGMFQMMSRSGVPGAQASYDLLKERFQRQGGEGRPEGDPTP